jgi:predicted transcriptional regulator
MNYHLTDKGKQLMKKYKGVLENMIDKWDSYN